VAAQRPGWLVKIAQPPYECPSEARSYGRLGTDTISLNRGFDQR